MIIYDKEFIRTGAHDTVLHYAGLLSINLRNDNVPEFDTRYVSLVNSELYDMEIHQKMSTPNDQMLKTIVKISGQESQGIKWC